MKRNVCLRHGYFSIAYMFKDPITIEILVLFTSEIYFLLKCGSETSLYDECYLAHDARSVSLKCIIKDLENFHISINL